MESADAPEVWAKLAGIAEYLDDILAGNQISWLYVY
jgi:hypothetical protein